MVAVTLAELEELKDHMRVKLPFSARGRELTEEDWRTVFKNITPKQLYERFAKAAGEVNDVKISIVLGKDADTSYLTIIHNDGFKSPKNYIDFHIYKDSVCLHGAYFDSGNTGKSIAKGYLRESFDLFKDMGIESVQLNANMVGSYAWVKFGFLPETPEVWNCLKADIAQRITPDGKTLCFDDKDYAIMPEASQAIKAILSSNKISDIVHLTELNEVIDPQKNLTVGKALLMNASYQAVLPLDDQDLSYQRFKAYTQERGLSIGLAK